jgi:hypothetical protein
MPYLKIILLCAIIGLLYRELTLAVSLYASIVVLPLVTVLVFMSFPLKAAEEIQVYFTEVVRCLVIFYFVMFHWYILSLLVADRKPVVDSYSLDVAFITLIFTLQCIVGVVVIIVRLVLQKHSQTRNNENNDKPPK